MKKIVNFLNKSVPINNNPWNIVILNTILVAFVLAIFQPFAFRLDSFGQLYLLVGFCTLVFITGLIFFVLLPIAFSDYFNPHEWTVRKVSFQIGSFLLFSGLLVFVYEYMLVGTILLEKHSFSDYFKKDFFIIYLIDNIATISICSIPITISMYMSKSKNLALDLSEIKKINYSLSQRLKTDDENDQITIEGTTKDSITVNINDIIYISSSGNYIEVHYVNDNKLSNKLLRSTIKQTESLLETYKIFVRCHRAFIVNTNKITNISGNAQGYKISLKGTSEEIPASRTYIPYIKDSVG